MCGDTGDSCILIAAVFTRVLSSVARSNITHITYIWPMDPLHQQSKITSADSRILQGQGYSDAPSSSYVCDETGAFSQVNEHGYPGPNLTKMGTSPRPHHVPTLRSHGPIS